MPRPRRLPPRCPTCPAHGDPAMINLEGIPVIAGDMASLREHAMMIAVAGTGYIDTGERVHNTWQGLRPHYVAPEAGQLMAATGPVATVCRHVGRNLQQARDALVVYADTVEAIQGELGLLRTSATDVNTAIEAAGPEWRSDHDLVDRSNAVGDAITVQAAAFVDAQRACVNALRALHGQPALTADNGDGVIDPATEFGYTLDQFRAAAQADPDDGGGLPWGSVTERDYPWYIDVGSAPLRFVGGLGDAVVNTALGLGALFGYDHATGQTTGATAGTAWTNLGKLALAVGTYAVPGGFVRDQLGQTPFLEPGEANQILTDTGKALIAYDQWDDDPARAAGNAVGNIALAVFGTKGAGAGLRGAGLALQLSRHGSLTARTGAVVTRAGEAIGRIPTLTDIAGNAWRHLHNPRADPIPTPDRAVPDTPVAPQPGSLADDLGNSSPSTTPADPARPAVHNPPDEGFPPSRHPDDPARAPATQVDDPRPREPDDQDIETEARTNDGAPANSALADSPTAGQPTAGPAAHRQDVPPPLRRDEPFEARELDEDFATEADPNNPDRAFYPDTVHYMDDAELEGHRVVAADGRLHWVEDGEIVDTSTAGTLHSGNGRAMFVMDQNGNFYVSLVQEFGHLHHSSFMAGRPVAGAGEMIIQDGRIVEVTRKSGHYKPTIVNEEAVRQSLLEQGFDVDGIRFTGGF